MVSCARCGHDPSVQVTSSWQFHIALPVHSGNRHIHNVGGSRWRYAKERNEWQAAIRAERLDLNIPAATGKRRVTFTRFYGGRQREFDDDNLRTGLKMVRDALIREGLICDDNSRSADFGYVQIQTSVEEQRGLLVTLEELA